MGFDFAQVSRGRTITSITDPAVLYDALPDKAEGYGYLRAVQKAVLDGWSARRNERDLVVKTNTGGGKTIAGLLALQVSLHEDLGPALYLAPDPHLAQRVVDEAGNLGLAVVDDPEASRFLSGEAICVTTMQVLVNGKSRLGLASGGTRQPVRVRSIVVDDAHAALALTEQNTTLRIPSSHQAYTKLLELFAEDLERQNRNALMDIRDNDYNAVLRIPFWAWSRKQDQVHQTLHPHRREPEFQWVWPLVGDLLPICHAVISADAIEVTPPCPPIEKFPSFHEADRRIYLTATLADDSVLVTHFDADPASITNPIVPGSAADLGDRLILAPQDLNPAIEHDDLRAAARHLAASRNVVVLVPSHQRAREWASVADRTVATMDEITDAVKDLTRRHVGLVVIVNRYDGIDLPDDACRVLVIDGLPQAYSGTERREAIALRDSEAMVTRQLQRLEQGMGRGVRSRDDRCVVFLFDDRRTLTRLIARQDVASRLSPATRAQLALSREVAGQLHDAQMSDLIAITTQVLDGDGDAAFRKVSRERLIGVTHGPANLSPTATHLRQAYNAASTGRVADAATHAGAAVQAAIDAGDQRLAGWLGETHAAYLDAVDRVKAQEVLTAASSRNPAVLRPLTGLTYRKITAGAAQAQQASATLTARYPTASEFLLGVEDVLSDIAWHPDHTDETEAALADLGEHLGLVTQRPEVEFGLGPDDLWALGEHRYAVIEAKSGATGDMIWKKDINQLAGSVNWCEREYGTDASVIPVMMHRRSTVEKTGTPPAGCRILTTRTLDQLKAAVRAWATALAVDEGYRDPARVALQLEQHRLTAQDVIAAYTVAARRQPT